MRHNITAYTSGYLDLVEKWKTASPDRIVPVVWPETIELAIDSINSASFLGEEQKDDIFFNNAARFLRLDETR